MREEIADAVYRFKAAGDKHIAYFSGLDLINAAHADDYLADQVHPNADGYEFLGRQFIEVVADKIP